MKKTTSIKNLVAGMWMLLVGGGPLCATTYTVTNTSDSVTDGSGTDGSLRYALSHATSGSDIIMFSLPNPATITLTSDELHITAPVTITGPGASQLTISGGGNFRVFDNEGSSPVNISNLTITQGNGTSSMQTAYPGEGGGIYSGGTMNLTNVTLTSNSAAEGGAIGIGGGTVTLANCTITGNSAATELTSPFLTGEGGGIFNYGTLTITGSTISNNTVTGSSTALGGGIFNANVGLSSTGVLNVISSTISGNSASGGFDTEGGGIENANGTMTITNSTLSGNSAGQGGGIENDGTGTVTGSTISGNTGRANGGGMFNNVTLTVTNSTISGNSAGNGAGVYAGGTAVSISFTTISGNSAGSNGGGILGGASVKNSIVANNGSGGNCYVYPPYMGTVNPPIVSGGYNLSDDTTCTTYFTQTGDLNDVAAGLATGLNNNGGPTLTIALLSGSPAIDAIPVSSCTDWNGNAVTADQRGTTRPQGPACDMGAYEYIEGTTTQSITFNALTNMPLGAASFTVSAIATSGLTVTFNSQTPTICAVSGANGTTVTLGGVGTCTIQATQDGNATYAAASPVNQSFQVTQGTLLSQTITFGPLANQPIATPSITVSATASSGLTVSFNSQTPSVCSVTGTTVSLGVAGTCTVQATQSGNATYAAALPVNQSFLVTLTSQTITFATLGDELLDGPPITLTAASTSGLTVSFTSATPGSCTVSGTIATLKAGGYCTIQATQAGNATYAPATPVSQTFLVETSPVSYGIFTHVNQFDPIDGNSDYITGNVGNGNTVPNVVAGAGGEYGQNLAQAGHSAITLANSSGSVTINAGPSVGVQSASNTGTGSTRALAFATFNAPPSGSFRVNAVLDGQFLSDCCSLPDGNLAATAQVFVVKTASFSLLTQPLAEITQAFMGKASTTAIDPNTAIDNLESVFAGNLYGSSQLVSLNQNEPNIFDTPLSYTLSTPLMTISPSDQFTVVFAAAADSLVGGSCVYACGTGEVYFIHTLQPAPNFFTDVNGNPVVGITPAGTPPPAPPAPGTLTLAPLAGTSLVGASASLTATVMDTTGAALPGAIVAFNVTSGPNAGLAGSGVSGANGQAQFSYIGKVGAGTDTIQASIGTLLSNSVRQTWTMNFLPSGSACNGAYNGTFNGNVTISSGQNCVLVGGTVNGNITQKGGSLTIGNFTVRGNVQIQGGGTFSIGSPALIDGNLQIENVPAPPGGGQSQVCSTTVNGNLQFENNGSSVQIGSTSASCAGNTINGNLQVENDSGATAIDGNTVTGNVQDETNTGATQVFSNTITGNLQCSGDSSITGGSNTATGKKQGQCVAF